ncbi:unnamed protein product [Cyprideis torosa]|uniref:Pyruvate kinase n=1 Tax=Cyprideis torosa TaxID=163714 RepID=A0A7R8ZQY7_9CRUS|nr:unnamed protein product [Cyprideis torosa]CAG0904030.1 unnamed protein product [Cyprideis torosa]
MKKKTKIVATIGPASDNEEILKELILSGVNVFRINFSHAKHEKVTKLVKLIRALSEELDENVAILGDLQGPKLRLGEIEPNTILKKGQDIILTSKEIKGDASRLYITYEDLHKDAKVGEKILLDDGKLILRVNKIENEEVYCIVEQGGEIKSNKGVNLPQTKVSLPALTDKDKEDALFAIEQHFDWIALSFVRHASDIQQLRDFILEKNVVEIPIIAKIEKPEALDNIDEIIKATDGIMVARGDLGIEIDMENVPLMQKNLVDKAKMAKKPVIIATQMLESMLESLTPSRAEVNDIANSVIDGADAVMLSGETAVGKYPVETVEKMAQIILKVEEDVRINVPHKRPEIDDDRFITDMICFNAAKMVKTAQVKAILALTVSGYTAFQLSSFRPRAHILIFTSNKRILSKLNLLWGVTAFYYHAENSTDDTVLEINQIALEKDYVKKGDYMLNLNATPLFKNSLTNTLRLTRA